MKRRISKLKAPFPWFGGKRRVAHIVWERFGNVPNYVEPFFGSGAVLLARPPEWPAKNETVNDLDCHIANFWRAVSADPELVAHHADWPVNEADLHARHQWLHTLEHHGGPEAFRDRMHSEPDFHDAQVAGLWVWGISCWIGDAWCRVTPQKARPHIHRSCGANTQEFRGDGTRLDRQRPNLEPGGVHAKRPRLGNGERGVQAISGAKKRPNVSSKGGVGVHRRGKLPLLNNTGEGVHRPSRERPQLGGWPDQLGMGIHTKACWALDNYMCALQARLRRVRVCCGEWHRILGPSPTFKIGMTAVFLDPPYGDADRDKVYGCDSRSLAGRVREWCVANGANEKMRIALCGYEGEHEELEDLGWSVVAWKAAGGYGARNKKNKNAHRERIWFSPACLQPEEETPLLTNLEAKP
jgi:hypothetical protein